MNNDLTVDSLVYGQTNSAKDDNSSVRRNSALGLNKPRELRISHVYGTGSKAGEIRSRAEFTLTEIDSVTGQVYETRAAVNTYQHGLSTTANMTAVLTKLLAFMNSSSPDYSTAVFVNKEI